MHRFRAPVQIGFAAGSALLWLGHLIAVSTGSLFVAYAACVLLCVLSAYHGIESLFRGNLNVGSLLASQTILWYTLPFTYIWAFQYDVYVPLLPVADAFAATALVAASCSAIFIFTEMWPTHVKLGNFEREMGLIAVILGPIILAQFYLIATGYWGYSTVRGMTGEEFPIYVQFIRSLAPAVPPICAGLLGIAARRKRRKLLIFCIIGFALIVQLMWWSSVGRRPMTVLAMISAASFFYCYYRGELTAKNRVVVTATLASCIPVVYFLWEAYFTIRMASNETGGVENLTILDALTARSEITSWNASDEFAKNIIRRPFSLVTSLALLSAELRDYIYGWNFVSQLLMIVPSAVFPGKIEYIGPVYEHLWSERLGLGFTDWSNTLFLESYMDFGVWGMPVYVLVLAVTANLLFRWANSIGLGTATAFMFFITAFSLYNIETSVTGFLVGFRSVVMILLTLTLLRALGVRGRYLPARVPERSMT